MENPAEMYLFRKLRSLLEKSWGYQIGEARRQQGTDSIDVYKISWNETIGLIVTRID